MNFKEISKSFKKLSQSKNKTRLIVLLGIIGIVLIAVSDIKPSKKSDVNTSSADAAVSTDDAKAYKEQVRLELENILSKIDGVGDCEVMLTVEGTAEYIYAENIQKSSDNDSNGSNEHFENEIVTVDENGGRQALVKKIIKPKISGVVVVCGGGGDITLKERVIKAVSAALDISYARICVEGKSKQER